jgi:hypothetical protein
MHISNGQHGKALQNYLKHLKYDTPETKNKFEAVIDQDGHNGIDEKEAKIALQRLDMFNRVDVTLLTEAEVDKIVSSFKKPIEAPSPLAALGTVYRVGKYDVVLAKKENIEIYLGVTLATFFEGVYPGLKEKSYGVTEKGGYLCDLTGRQSAVLMEAINQKFPKLNIKMLNFSAAEDVAKILKERQVHKDYGNWWIKTGTVLNEEVAWEDQEFDEPGLVSTEDIKHLPEETKFVYRGIDEGAGAWDFPGSLLYRGLVIFAIERKTK